VKNEKLIVFHFPLFVFHLSNLLFFAASTVFFISIATVRSPTPPGTGVKYAAFVRASFGFTSPTKVNPRFSIVFRRFSISLSSNNSRASVSSETLLMPTSITVAPSLMCSARITKRSTIF
jgi:hypothetical protein